MTNEAADILRKAKELIETKGWCQHAYARGKNARVVSEYGRSAVCFCPVGAIHRLTKDDNALYYSAFWCLVRVVNSPFKFNDKPGRTKAEVLSAFDRAIALAEAGNNA